MMDIKNLEISNTALKLRHFDKETKSKILMDVKWHLLSNNKQPYLSVNVRQVKHNGIVFNNWGDEQKAVIEEINKDFSFLLAAHLSTPDGSGMHQLANLQYHFKLTQDHFGQDIYTSEKHNDKMVKLWDVLENHSLFTFLFKDFGHSKDVYFKEYLNKTNDKYLHSNANISVEHWINQINLPERESLRNSKTYKEKLENSLISFFGGIDQYRKLEGDHKYKNLPNNNGVWTPQKLGGYYNIPLENVMVVLSTIMQEEKQALIKAYSDQVTAKNKIKLEELTNKYKIPLVITK